MAAHPEPRTVRFISAVDKKVVSTFEGIRADGLTADDRTTFRYLVETARGPIVMLGYPAMCFPKILY